VADDEEILERLMLREAAHPLKADARLVAAGGADRHHRAGRAEEVVDADLRRECGLRVAAREDRAHLARGPEVRVGDPLLVGVQRLVDQFAEAREARKPWPHLGGCRHNQYDTC